MNGVHDMGGQTDFGPVIPEPATPIFHADWEKRVFGLVHTLISRQQRWDEFRFALERIEPVHYLASSYYERWLTALEGYLVERGVIADGEISVTAPLQPAPTAPTQIPYATSTTTKPLFRTGDPVRTRTINPPWHTRLPRYARGKRGVIHRYHGVTTFADANSAGLGEQRQPIYSVRFEGHELWGVDAQGASTKPHALFIDLWECYLERSS
jgi:nitrile hydratase